MRKKGIYRSLPVLMAAALLLAAPSPVLAEDDIVFDDYVTEETQDAGSPAADEAQETQAQGSEAPAADEAPAAEDGVPAADEAPAAADEAEAAENPAPAMTAAEAEAENKDGDETYVSNTGEVFTIPRGVDRDLRIYDYANLLSDSEEDRLRERIHEIEEKKKADIVILTSEDIPYDADYGTETTMKYAEQFLMDNGFREDAIIFTIDMKNRVLWTAGHGKYADEKYVEYEREVYDAAMSHARDGEYGGAAEAFLDITYRLENIGHAVIPTFFSLVVSSFLSLLGVIGLLAKHGSVQPSRENVPPVKVRNYRTLNHDAVFLGTVRTVRRIERPKSSSSHSGGGFSGGSHSGGGFSGGGGSFSGGGGHF